MRLSMRPLLLPAVTVVFVAAACGKSSGPSSPTGPTGSTPASAPGPASYVGSVALPGTTGVLVVNTSSSVAWLPRPDALAVLLDLVAPRVLAQGATAGGTLALDDSTTVWLTGTGGGGGLQLSGPGGYSVTASVSRGALSGTVTTPAGSGTVSPLVQVNLEPEGETDREGAYEATYSMTTSGYFRNVALPSQTIQRDCGYTVELTGTLRLENRCCATDSGGFRVTVLRDSWRETRTILPPCQGATNFSPTIIEPAGGNSQRLIYQVTNVLQFGIEDKVTNPNGGTSTRFSAFVGGYTTGAAAIGGTLVRAANNVVPTSAGQHVAGFPPVRIAVTLQRVCSANEDRRCSPSTF